MFNNRENNDKKLFNDIATSYVQKGPNTLLSGARKQRLVKSIEGIKKPIRNLLEVGCGAGFLQNI